MVTLDFHVGYSEYRSGLDFKVSIRKDENNHLLNAVAASGIINQPSHAHCRNETCASFRLYSAPQNGLLSSSTSAEETGHLSCVRLRKAWNARNAQVIAWVGDLLPRGRVAWSADMQAYDHVKPKE